VHPILLREAFAMMAGIRHQAAAQKTMRKTRAERQN
jgi:hypothetical protein